MSEKSHFQLDIEGMTCGHCKMAVERMIREAGIEQVEVDLASGKAQVEASEHSLEKAVELINESGIYKAKRS